MNQGCIFRLSIEHSEGIQRYYIKLTNPNGLGSGHGNILKNQEKKPKDTSIAVLLMLTLRPQVRQKLYATSRSVCNDVRSRARSTRSSAHNR